MSTYWLRAPYFESKVLVLGISRAFQPYFMGSLCLGFESQSRVPNSINTRDPQRPLLSLYRSSYRRPTIYQGRVKEEIPNPAALVLFPRTSATTDHSTYSPCSLRQSSSDTFQLRPACQGYLCKCKRVLMWTEPADCAACQASLYNQSIAEHCK